MRRDVQEPQHADRRVQQESAGIRASLLEFTLQQVADDDDRRGQVDEEAADTPFQGVGRDVVIAAGYRPQQVLVGRSIESEYRAICSLERVVDITITAGACRRAANARQRD